LAEPFSAARGNIHLPEIHTCNIESLGSLPNITEGSEYRKVPLKRTPKSRWCPRYLNDKSITIIGLPQRYGKDAEEDSHYEAIPFL
jgi:hypothetical protein